MVETFEVSRQQETAHPPRFDSSVDFAPERPFDASPFHGIDTSGAELVVQSSNCITLDLDHLESFEAVTTQYEHLGVRFSNAIALQPSNPAFPPLQGNKVLMGAPKSGWLEATFVKPVQFVSGSVTGSRRTVLMGFDETNQLIAQSETPGANLAEPDASTAPNTQLRVTAQNICRVTLSSFSGQFTLGDFSFGF